LGNMGVSSPTPLLSRFLTPVGGERPKPGPFVVRNDDFGRAAQDAPADGRWSQGLYLDQPEEWDDPYRFFRW